MNRRRRRVNWFWITMLVILIGLGVYMDRVVIPTIPPPFVPTPTATRDPESFISEAEALFNEGKLLQSIETYRSALRTDPKDAATYVALARVQVFAGQYAEAQSSAEDALLLNPNNSTAHAVRAWALDFQGDYLGAEAAIKRALELDPNNPLAHAFYAEILVDSYYSGSGPFDSIELAIEASRVALSLAPDSLEAHRARAYVLEATANYEEAIAEYQAAINVNDNIADLHLALGRNYRVLGVYDQAVAEFTRANALNPSDPTPDLLISRTYATVGEYAKAAQYGEQAIKDDALDANLHGNLGVMYYKNFQWPEAVDELSLAIYGGTVGDGQVIEPVKLENGSRSVEYYFTYAIVLAKMNRCGDALQVAQTILGTVPGNELAVDNANAAISLCETNLASPPTSTPPPTPVATEAAPTS